MTTYAQQSRDMCKEESRPPEAPMDLQMSLWSNATLFSTYLLFLWPNLMCKWQTKVLLDRIYPLLQYLMPPPQPRELVGGWNIVN